MDINCLPAITLIVVGGCLAFAGWLAINGKASERFYESNPGKKQAGLWILLYNATGLLSFWILSEAWRMREDLGKDWQICIWGLIVFFLGVLIILVKPL